MPIPVECPSCSARVTAPDAAAGKRVRCPKCQQPVPVPAADDGFEVVDDAPPAKPSTRRVVEDDADDRPRKKPARRDADDADDERPARKSRRDEDEDEADERPAKKSSRRVVVAEDDDEGEEEDDRPRKRKGKDRDRRGKKRPSSGGGGNKKLLAIGGAALGVIVLIVGGLFIFTGGKPAAPGGLADSPPAGFSAARDAAGGFAVYIPGTARKSQYTVNGQDGEKIGHYAWASQTGQRVDPATGMPVAKPDVRDYWVMSRKLEPGANAGTSPEQLFKLLSMYEPHVDNHFGMRVVNKRPLTLGGQPGLEVKVLEAEGAGGWMGGRRPGRDGDDGFFPQDDDKGPIKPKPNGRRIVYYVTTDGKRLFTIRAESNDEFAPDDVLKTIADSFTIL